MRAYLLVSVCGQQATNEKETAYKKGSKREHPNGGTQDIHTGPHKQKERDTSTMPPWPLLPVAAIYSCLPECLLACKAKQQV